MATRLNGDAVRWLEALDREGSLAELGDWPLLERFLAESGAAGEAAFEVLVRRHGPMVLAICRGVLRDVHDADDAFQATFLVLARRASTVRGRDRLAPWLARVARRIAWRARREAARRANLERRAARSADAAEALAEPIAVEAADCVRAEVNRLPESDRMLLQLTYWQGKTYEEAAALLSWPIGTVRSRLSRARERLRGRLARLGPTPMIAAARTPLATDALIARTVGAAAWNAGGISAAVEAGVVPASVAALVNGELSMMAVFPWKSIAVLLLLGGGVTAGVASMTARTSEPAAPPARANLPAMPPASPPAQGKTEVRPLLTNGDLSEAEGKGDTPRSWTTGAAIPGVEYTWSRTGHAGPGSLRLKKTANRYFPIAQWSQKFPHQGNSPRLKVSAWIKADHAAKAILDAQFIDNQRKTTHAWVAYIGARDAGDPPVTHDWKRYEGVVEIPPGTKHIIIAPQIYGPGDVWFDDLEATYTTDAKTDPLGS